MTSSGQVTEAVIVQIRIVLVEASTQATIAGAATGGTLGAILARKRSHGAQALAALMGAGAGGAVASQAGVSKAAEIIVRFLDGQTRVIIQEFDGPNRFFPGDRVFVTSSFSGARIISRQN